MFVVGTTQKLKKELGIDLEEYDEARFGTEEIWHMNLFKIGRYNCIKRSYSIEAIKDYLRTLH